MKLIGDIVSDVIIYTFITMFLNNTIGIYINVLPYTLCLMICSILTDIFSYNSRLQSQQRLQRIDEFLSTH